MAKYTLTYTDGLGRIHTAEAESVSVTLSGADRYTDSRGRFSKTAFLRDMDKAEVRAVPYLTDKDYVNWRSTASYVGHIFGSAFQFRRVSDIINIKRLI